jgi:hypothetical protein
MNRGLDKQNNILVIVIGVAILVIAVKNMRKVEGFEDVIEIISPDYGENEANPLYEIDDDDAEVNEDDNKEVFDNTENSSGKKATSSGGVSIQQSGMKGTGNIFTPQIIIKSNDSGSGNVRYRKQNTQEDAINGLTNVIFNRTQQPDSNIWSSNNGSYDVPEDVSKNAWEEMQEEATHKYYNNMVNGNDDISMPFDSYTSKPDNTNSSTNSKNKKPMRKRNIGPKEYYPGYSIFPPDRWDVPQKRPPACIPDKWNRPSAVFTQGTPVNVLELDKDGKMKIDENNVTFTNVGSILPKFEFKEKTNY